MNTIRMYLALEGPPPTRTAIPTVIVDSEELGVGACWDILALIASGHSSSPRRVRRAGRQSECRKLPR